MTDQEQNEGKEHGASGTVVGGGGVSGGPGGVVTEHHYGALAEKTLTKCHRWSQRC